MFHKNIKGFVKQAVIGSAFSSCILVSPVSGEPGHRISELASVLALIQKSYERRGDVTAFIQNTDARSCENLLTAFGALRGETKRYDFIIRADDPGTNLQIVACVQTHSSGSRSFEYFPASVFDRDETLEQL
ncbi:MAG: hypothetical protein AAF423_02465 [Pseudomonadota bacterium]